MFITEPNDFVAEVHDRMPVVLEAKDFTPWLNDGGQDCSSPPPTTCRNAGRVVARQ
jgi:putative SOS response-associated peptidase YedK